MISFLTIFRQFFFGKMEIRESSYVQLSHVKHIFQNLLLKHAQDVAQVTSNIRDFPIWHTQTLKIIKFASDQVTGTLRHPGF